MKPDIVYQKPDLGDQALKPHLLPWEVFITNAQTEKNPFYEESITGDEIANRLRNGERYQSVRVLPVAFSTDGTPIKNQVAVVGVPKVTQQTP